MNADEDALIERLKRAEVTIDAVPVIHRESTLQTVYDALKDAGLAYQQITDAVSEMQNAGILFRERAGEVAP